MVVYYRGEKNGGCVFNSADCYLCTAKKCVKYSDGVCRVEITQEQLNALKKRKDIKILKVKEV